MSRVLITDDSSAQRLIISDIAQKMGHEIDTACNGQEAIEKIQANQPDCLLLDMLMPVMDGMKVLETLESKGIKIPIIVLTADVQTDLKEQCLEFGVHTFMNKPIRKDKLQEALNEILSSPQPTEAPCT